MINFQFFPRSHGVTPRIREIIECFKAVDKEKIANEFRKKIGKGMLSTEILRFKFFIISNATLSKQVKNLSKPDLLERPVELNVWTLERFFQTFASNSSEIIEIDTVDFDCQGIQCLKADLGQGS